MSGPWRPSLSWDPPARRGPNNLMVPLRSAFEPPADEGAKADQDDAKEVDPSGKSLWHAGSPTRTSAGSSPLPEPLAFTDATQNLGYPAAM